MSEDRAANSRVRHLTGGCQCGAVRYAFFAPPTDISICHCRMCQKAVGGPFGVFVTISTANFEWTRGAPATWASSSVGLRDFCSTCGTPLAFRDIGGRDIELLGGTLDQPERGAPTRENGVESKLAWLTDLPRLPSRTTVENRGPDPIPVVSRQHPDHDT